MIGATKQLITQNKPTEALLLQKIFGHLSVSQTLDYIGIIREEIEEAYDTLNLGGVE